MTRKERIRRLEALLKEATEHYRALVEASASTTERNDWKLDLDDVERAAIYAGNQADREDGQ